VSGVDAWILAERLVGQVHDNEYFPHDGRAGGNALFLGQRNEPPVVFENALVAVEEGNATFQVPAFLLPPRTGNPPVLLALRLDLLLCGLHDLWGFLAWQKSLLSKVN